MNWTNREQDTIKALARRQELTEEQVLRQALKLYQLYALGIVEARWHQDALGVIRDPTDSVENVLAETNATR